ncbi:hypothetical protein [Naasia aerilata]|uniref:hypothetical protein n=1 Tax=Naasia aerilata TaxID=1162966 RepID=UPI0025735306|nr:hypothetical protein [Naasia aerilata]
MYSTTAVSSASVTVACSPPGVVSIARPGALAVSEKSHSRGSATISPRSSGMTRSPTTFWRCSTTEASDSAGAAKSGRDSCAAGLPGVREEVRHGGCSRSVLRGTSSAAG